MKARRSAIHMIERCMRRQRSLWLHPESPATQPHPRHGIVMVEDGGPNLVLWNGCRHQVVMTLKDDDEQGLGETAWRSDIARRGAATEQRA